MRRMTTAAVAAATALSLVTIPATAQDGSSNEGNTSSQDSGSSGNKHGGGRVQGVTSSFESIAESAEGSSDEERNNLSKFLQSSVDNDDKNGYDLGTTFDILLGTGIAALLLVLAGGAAAQFGGFKLPF